MSVSPANQSPADQMRIRQERQSKVRTTRSRALEFAVAVDRLETALASCWHWQGPEKAHERRWPEGTYRCCSRVLDAQAACAAVYEALAREVTDA